MTALALATRPTALSQHSVLADDFFDGVWDDDEPHQALTEGLAPGSIPPRRYAPKALALVSPTPSCQAVTRR